MHSDAVDNLLLQDSALYDAVCQGNVEVIRSLLSQGVDIHSKVKGPFSCIHIAVEKGFTNVTEILLINGADPDLRYPLKDKSEEGDSLLHHAVEKGYETIVKLLLKYEANVDVRSNNGATPLHVAAEKGFKIIARILVEAGGDIGAVTTPNNDVDYYLQKFHENEAIRFFLDLDVSNVQDVLITDKSYSPLHVAVMNSHENMVKFLLERGADKEMEDSDGNSVLHIAVEKGDPKIVDLVLSYLPDITVESNRKALLFAVENVRKVYKVIVEKLLCYGFSLIPDDLDKYGLLFRAAGNNHTEIVAGLLKMGANVNETYPPNLIYLNYDLSTLLHLAVDNGNEDMVRLLLDHGANVNVGLEEKTPLFYAVKNLNFNITKLLLENGAKVEDPHILITAVDERCLEFIEIIILYGADVNKPVNSCGKSFDLPAAYEQLDSVQPPICSTKTALFIAAEKGYEETVKVLIQKGADILFKADSCDLNSLLISVINGHVKVAEVLLKFGADVNVLDYCGRSALRLATEMGHKDVVKLLLRYDATVESQFRSSMTVFLLACKRGHLEIVSLLLKYGANISAVDWRGKTALITAGAYGHHEIIKFLLDHGAAIDAQQNQPTALHISAQEGHLKCVDVLLTYGAYIDFSDADGMTALHFAARCGRIDVVKLLLKHGAKVSAMTNGGLSPLWFASGIDAPSLVEVLLKHGANPNATVFSNSTPFWMACFHGHLANVKILLKYGAKVGPEYKINDNGSPLWVAAEENHVEIVDTLLKVGVNNSERRSALRLAAEKGHGEIVKLLLDNYVDPEDSEIEIETPLIVNYAEKSNLSMIKSLLMHGVNVTITDSNGKTALHFAAENGLLEMVELLLSKRVDVNAETKNGETPFLLSVMKGHLSVTKFLLKRGAKINSVDHLNRTGLYLAAEYGRTEVLNYLLESDANVNLEAVSGTGKTPLLIAAERDHFKIVEVLLRHGARADARDSDGLTALYFAVEFRQVKMVEYLLKKGISIDCQTRNGLPLILIAAQRGHSQTVKILLTFGSAVNVFGRADSYKHFQDNIPKWKPQVFQSILDFSYVTADYGYPENLSDLNVPRLFEILNNVDTFCLNGADELNYRNLAKILVYHTVKMKAANLYPREENLVSRVFSDEINDYQARCVAEIESMKTRWIDDSSVSLYNILTASLHQSAIYAKNDSLVENFSSIDLDSNFPIYSSIIKGQFEKGRTVKELRDQAVKVLFHSSMCETDPFNGATLVCLEEIVKNLNVKELRNLKWALPRS